MKPNYLIFSDSCANLTDEQIEELDVNIVSMKFVVDGQVVPSYVKGRNNDLKFFYDLLRSGKLLTTSSLNISELTEAFTPALECGLDVVFLSFSSGLSGNYNNAVTTKAELTARFPGRRIEVVDTLSGSYGQGLLLAHMAGMRQNGSTLDEVLAWVEAEKHKVLHWFTVDDLAYLYRGGRISRTAYVLGKLAQIKPMLRVDDEGHIIPAGKVLGRKKSVCALAETVINTIVNPSSQILHITHADCRADADLLVKRITQKIAVKDVKMNYVDPVMGCHGGPGTLAAFYISTGR